MDDRSSDSAMAMESHHIMFMDRIARFLTLRPTSTLATAYNQAWCHCAIGDDGFIVEVWWLNSMMMGAIRVALEHW